MCVKYSDLYSLNFDYLNNFFVKMWDVDNSKFNACFFEAKLGMNIVKDCQDNKKLSEQLSQFFVSEHFTEGPGTAMFKEYLQGTQLCYSNGERLLKEFGGADPFRIQVLVNYVLGISQDKEMHFLPGERRAYLQLMCESGFLSGSQCFFNIGDEGAYKYQPEALAAKFLKENPQIKTLTIGCGKNTTTRPGSCLFRRKEDHQHDALRIDLSAVMGPDVVVDMHNLNFWKAIPDHYFENIEDHTYGYFLLENPASAETLREVFRTLKPGGCLLFDLPFKSESQHIPLLKQAGFSVEGENAKKAFKNS
jgi:hypothetical protein